MSVAALLLFATFAAEPLGPGDYTRELTVEGRERTYLVHIPPSYDPEQPMPVVLVLHGAGLNAALMVCLTDMNSKADAEGFIVAYPNGAGCWPFQTWNAGQIRGGSASRQADDVQFTRLLLDDLAAVANVDSRQVFATGHSNGGMMCYRLAADLSDRIAAIAPIAGTMALDSAAPPRPVSVLHFHGTDDKVVPPGGSASGSAPKFLFFQSVAESLRIWRQINGCPETPTVVNFPDTVADGTTVKQLTFGPGTDGAEVILVRVKGGGHTWPGETWPLGFLGNSTLDESANDLMWDFFQRHPMD